MQRVHRNLLAQLDLTLLVRTAVRVQQRDGGFGSRFVGSTHGGKGTPKPLRDFLDQNLEQLRRVHSALDVARENGRDFGHGEGVLGDVDGRCHMLQSSRKCESKDTQVDSVGVARVRNAVDKIRDSRPTRLRRE